MKVIIQKVTRSCVKVEGSVISSIRKGLLLLVGFSTKDTKDDIELLSRKILYLRLFDDENGKKWSKNVIDKQYDILCVSQFTLYGVLKGLKPDFHKAMKSDDAKVFFSNFVEALRCGYKPEMVREGAFGEYMEVELCNDGPVTITLESICGKITNDETGQ